MDASTSSQFSIGYAYSNFQPYIPLAITQEDPFRSQFNNISLASINPTEQPRELPNHVSPVISPENRAWRFHGVAIHSILPQALPHQPSDLALPPIAIDPRERDFQIESPKKYPTRRRRPKANRPPNVRVCSYCGTTNTPEWRKGPWGSHTLCNADGLKYTKLCKMNPIKLPDGTLKQNPASVAKADEIFKKSPWKLQQAEPLMPHENAQTEKSESVLNKSGQPEKQTGQELTFTPSILFF